MNLIACDGQWKSIGQAPICTGRLTTVAHTEISPGGLTAEDHSDLQGHALVLFAIVFGALVLRKALKP